MLVIVVAIIIMWTNTIVCMRISVRDLEFSLGPLAGMCVRSLYLPFGLIR